MYKTTPFKTIKNYKTFRNIKCPKIIILDNDECLGQFGIFSIIACVAKINDYPKVNFEKLKKSLVKHVLSKGAARPYLINLFKLMYKLKKQGKIDKVVMYTSAPNRITSNKSGYVYFLKDCLERYCGTPKLYDMVFHRDNTKSKVSRCGATIKDVGNVLLKNNYLRHCLFNKNRKISDFVNHFSKNILMIDDKPQNIIKRHGRVIGVKAYTRPCGLIDIYKCVHSVPNLERKLKNQNSFKSLFEETREDLLKYSGTNKKDKELIKVCNVIIKKYS